LKEQPMQRLARRWLVCSYGLVTACGGATDRPANTPAAATPDTAVMGPMAIMTVIYNNPKDTAAFEQYGRETHIPLLTSSQEQIGFVRADFTRFESDLEGGTPAFYRQAELYFPTMDAARKGLATPAFKKVADDLGRFANGGFNGLIALETSPPTPAAGGPAAIFTVIYNQPKDTTAFEQYYAETHVPFLEANQAEIGFAKAELTRFQSNLDGSPPAFHRQAELYFASMDHLKRGIATPEFKKVADDLANFATGGISALIAMETR
jgi:uncharacterized protein (TIGR02118 family)